MLRHVPPMPWRLSVVCSATGVVGGVVVGFVQGLHHVPTLVFALGEGAILVGVPATIVGLVLVAAWFVVDHSG